MTTDHDRMKAMADALEGKKEANTHELKCWPEYFEAIISGAKTFEARKDDRGFQVGDTLRIREWDPNGHFYTDREITRTISYILRGGSWGIEPGNAVLALAAYRAQAEEPKYRIFDPREEPIHDGDEFQEPDGKWHPFSPLCIGMTLARHAKPYPSRRPITPDAR